MRTFNLGRNASTLAFILPSSTQIPRIFSGVNIAFVNEHVQGYQPAFQDRRKMAQPREMHQKLDASFRYEFLFCRGHFHTGCRDDLPRGDLSRTAQLDRAQRTYHNLIYFNEVDKGGHFSAGEEPQLFAAEVRAAFRTPR